MPRPRQRACLQEGLSLNLNRLARRGFIRPGSATGPLGIRWTNSYLDEEVAAGLITADMSGRHEGWFRIQIGQSISGLLSCHARDALAAGSGISYVLWKPFGARDFCLPAEMERQVEYSSQFQSAADRAH